MILFPWSQRMSLPHAFGLGIQYYSAATPNCQESNTLTNLRVRFWNISVYMESKNASLFIDGKSRPTFFFYAIRSRSWDTQGCAKKSPPKKELESNNFDITFMYFTMFIFYASLWRMIIFSSWCVYHKVLPDICRYESSPAEVASSCNVTIAMLADPDSAVCIFSLIYTVVLSNWSGVWLLSNL